VPVEDPELGFRTRWSQADRRDGQDEFGGTRLHVSQGRLGEGRERFVIVRLHPALERDGESEHGESPPRSRAEFVMASLAQGSGDRFCDPRVLE
jgi:hypothetical protein